MKKLMMSVVVMGSMLLGACSEEVVKEETKAVEQTEEKQSTPKKSDAQIKKEQEKKEKEAAAEKERADGERYLNEVVSASNTISIVLNDFSEQNAKAGSNPYIMTTNDWVMDTVLVLTRFGNSVQEFRNIQEPINPELKQAHVLLMKAMDEYQFVIDNYPKGVDNLDADLINECWKAFERSTAHVEEATAIGVMYKEKESM